MLLLLLLLLLLLFVWLFCLVWFVCCYNERTVINCRYIVVVRNLANRLHSWARIVRRYARPMESTSLLPQPFAKRDANIEKEESNWLEHQC